MPFLLDDISVEKPVRIEITYNNVGREPALDAHTIFRVKAIDKRRFDDGTVGSIIEADRICGGVGTKVGSDSVFPGNPAGYKFHIKTQDDRLTAYVVSGKQHWSWRSALHIRLLEKPIGQPTATFIFWAPQKENR